MTHPILADRAASISQLKANPMKVVASGQGMPIAVLNRNAPAFYCVPAAAYEANSAGTKISPPPPTMESMPPASSEASEMRTSSIRDAECYGVDSCQRLPTGR